jgi:RimJ/RimL family protein N-acetyltransferase
MTLFETERLRIEALDASLVKLALEDRPGLARALEATVHPDWPQPDMAGLLGFLLSELSKRPGSHQYGGLIVAKDPAVVVGDIGFHQLPDDIVIREGSGEIGYSVVPEWRGNGLATEAVGGLTEWGFGKLGLQRIYAHCAPDNVPSHRVLLKNGFQQVSNETSAMLLFERKRLP